MHTGNAVVEAHGLALDAKNHVLFAACGQSGNRPVTPAQPMMVILNANDGKIIISLPLAGGSDGAVFNPATMEAFSAHGNGTMTIIKEKKPPSPGAARGWWHRPTRWRLVAFYSADFGLLLDRS